MNQSASNPPDPAEAELFRRARDGDLQAFAKLCEHLRPTLLRSAAALLPPNGAADGEDLAQETFLRLFLDRDKLQDVSHFERRARVILKHLVLDLLKNCDNHRTTPLPESFEDMEAGPLGAMKSDSSSDSAVSLIYAVEEMKPLTKTLGQPIHAIAGWMLEAFATNGGFPSVREIAAHWRLGHGTAADYRTRILATWRHHLELYGLGETTPGNP